MRIIRVGDTVTYRPRGNSARRTAKVLSIEICRTGIKYGREVRTCDLDKHSEVTLNLDDHHWIFKSQIVKINKGE